MLRLNIRNIFLYFLIIIVSILVIVAVYSNKYKFTGSDILRYRQISLDNKNNLSEIVNNYSDYNSREKFLREMKKVNNISSLSQVSKKTIIIPIINPQ